MHLFWDPFITFQLSSWQVREDGHGCCQPWCLSVIDAHGHHSSGRQCHCSAMSWKELECGRSPLPSRFVTFWTTTRCPLYSNSNPVDLTPLPELAHRQSLGPDNAVVRCTAPTIHHSRELVVIGHKSKLGLYISLYLLVPSFPHRSQSLSSSSPFCWPQASLHPQVIGQLTSKTTSPHRHLHNTVTCIPSHQHINLQHPIATPQTPIPHPFSPHHPQPPSCKSKSACASQPAKAA